MAPLGIAFMLNALSLLAVLLSQEAEPGPSLAEGWELELLPARNIYRAYLADPRQGHSGVKVKFPVRAGDDVKIENSLGSYRPLALWTNPRDAGEEAELFLELGSFSRFDITQGWDMDAADYKIGVPFDYRLDTITLKVEMIHRASFLGDEFISHGKDFGRKPIDYHLSEFVAGGQWTPEPDFRAYAEAGVSVYRSADAGSGRVQAGAEWLAPPWHGWLTPYVATDLSSRHEQHWALDSTITAGIWVRGKSGTNGLRFALEYYRGRDQEAQFMSRHEQNVAFNIAGDF